MTLLQHRKGDFTLPDAKYQYGPDLKLEPVHMDVHLSFDIQNKTVSGYNQITLRSNAVNANSIRLNAKDFDKVDVSVENASWDYDNEIIYIKWSSSIPQGSDIKIKINYSVVDPVAGLYFSHPDEQYPERAIYVVSDHETERARYWLPCIDHPNIRTTFDWVLTSKSEFTYLANGKEKSRNDNGDGTVTSHWHHDFPCPSYISVVAIGDFVEFKDRDANGGKGPIPVAYYTNKPYNPDNLRLALDSTPSMIEWLSDKIGTPMAWPKYYQILLSNLWGAMENQSLVAWSDFAVIDETLVKEVKQFIDSVNIHEMAHTYFGDMVVVRDFGHAWLKESWATYIESVYLEDTLGKNEFHYNLYLKSQDYQNEVDNQYIRPIVTRKYDHTWSMFDSHLYPGGAWRIHMLRMVLGDDIFWKGVQNYVKTFNGKNVETIDFQRKLEEVSSLNLSEFFDQWILNANGYPKLEISFNYSKEESNGKFIVKQVQKGKGQDKPYIFNFQLDLGWVISNESSHKAKTVEIKEKSHTFIFQMDEEPAYICLNPELTILAKIKLKSKDKYLQNQLKSPNLIGKILAAQALAKKGTKTSLDAIFEAAKLEDFWGCRREFYREIGRSKTRAAIDILLSALDVEDHPQVLQTIFAHLGKYRDKKITNALINYETSRLGPYTQSTLLNALSNQREGPAKDYLLDSLGKSSWQNIVKTRTYGYLSNLRNLELLPMLLEKSKYGNEVEKARPSIISASANLAFWGNKLEKKQTIENLIDATRDFDEDVRKAASRGLRTLKAREGIPFLESMKSTLSEQDQVPVTKIIKAIRSSSEEDKQVSGLKKDVEDLTEKLQKLEAKVEKLEAEKSSNNI